jgi:hypothetical protein
MLKMDEDDEEMDEDGLLDEEKDFLSPSPRVNKEPKILDKDYDESNKTLNRVKAFSFAREER